MESDLYALGAIIYHLYAGRNLFEDSEAQLLRHKCLYAAPAPLVEISDTPPSISEAVSQLISRDRSCRAMGFDQLRDIFPVQVPPAQRAPLSGRVDELERATKILSSAGSGIRIVEIEGDIGTGKTRIVEELEFRHELGRGHFLIGRSYERDNRQFEPILQILSERLRREDKELDEWIRTEGVGFSYSLRTLLPDFKDRFAAGVSALKLTKDKLVADLAGTLLSMTKRDPSIVVAMEDIHWADEGTERVLEQIALRSGGANLHLLVTHRTDVNLTTRHLRLDSFRFPGVDLEKLLLRGLNVKDARDMARSLTADLDQLTWIVANGAGNPLFLEECARYGELTTHKLPQRISDILFAKTNRLHASLKSIVELLALFPRPISIELAIKVIRSLPGSSGEKIEELVTAGILVNHSGQLGFRHDGIRESIYRHISPNSPWLKSLGQSAKKGPEPTIS